MSNEISDLILRQQWDRLARGDDDDKAKKRIAAEIKRRQDLKRMYAERRVSIGPDGRLAGPVRREERITFGMTTLHRSIHEAASDAHPSPAGEDAAAASKSEAVPFAIDDDGRLYYARKDAPGQSMFDWDESKHPRDEKGEFASVATGHLSISKSGSMTPPKPAEKSPEKSATTVDKSAGAATIVDTGAKGTPDAKTTGETNVTIKQPWEMTRDEYKAEYAGNLTDAKRKELRERGFTGSWTEQIQVAMREGKDVPQHVIDTNAPAIQAQAVGKLKKEFGLEFIKDLRDKSALVKMVHEVMGQNGDYTTVRRKQVGPQGFAEHAKGDFVVLPDGTPKVVSKVKKPYVGKHDGGTTGYFQDIGLRDPKPVEQQAIAQAQKSAKAISIFDGASRNDDYPDLKKTKMDEFSVAVRDAIAS